MNGAWGNGTMKLPVAIGLVTLLTLLMTAPAADAASVIRRGTAATPAALQAAIDSFRVDLGGVNNGVGGTFTSGRREINWDGVPDSFALPNNLPFNFFNSNSPRGVVFSTLEAGSALNQFMVSADSDNPTTTPVRFGNFNASYATAFQAFSAERLFHLRGGDTMILTFFLPGTNIPASVSGIGVVYADVDAAANVRLICFDPDGQKLVGASGDVQNNGLSFLGIFFTSPEERCSRVEIRAGNVDLVGGAADGTGGVDVIALDDFIYGEPRSVDALLRDGFE